MLWIFSSLPNFILSQTHTSSSRHTSPDKNSWLAVYNSDYCCLPKFMKEIKTAVLWLTVHRLYFSNPYSRVKWPAQQYLCNREMFSVPPTYVLYKESTLKYVICSIDIKLEMSTSEQKNPSTCLKLSEFPSFRNPTGLQTTNIKAA